VKGTLDMRSQSPRRLIAAALTALPVMLVISACGSTTAGKEHHATPTAYEPALHNALPAAVRASGVLRIATDASYAPAESFGADGSRSASSTPTSPRC